jgi:hypothetical protein
LQLLRIKSSMQRAALPHLGNATAEQVRPLVDACRHQQSAIAAALDDELFRPAVPLLVQVLSTRLQHVQQ